jgi:hypothetical protein
VPRPAIYSHVAEKIYSQIRPYDHDCPIPTIRSLARQYDASINTVRKALAILQEQGEIVSLGRGRRFVRHRQRLDTSYCKPYPAVGVLSFFRVCLSGENYAALLLGSFLHTLRRNNVAVSIPPVLDKIRLKPIPGGVIVGPPESRFSAVAFPSGAPEELLAELVETGTVVMTLDYLSEVDGVDSVAVDCDAEADAAVGYLHKLGHRHIAFLAPRQVFKPTHWTDGIDPDCRRFSRAMLWAKQRSGLDNSPDYHIEFDGSPAASETAVRSAIDRLWRLEPRPTGIVCFEPGIAAQARSILQARRIPCPSQVSILIRDSIGQARPKFTTLASDPHRMGASAAEHMLNRLTNPSVSPTRLLFASRLIEGLTTVAAPTTSPAIV